MRRMDLFLEIMKLRIFFRLIEYTVFLDLLFVSEVVVLEGEERV